MNLDRLKIIFKMFNTGNFFVELSIFNALIVTSLSTFVENYLGLSTTLMCALVITLSADFVTGIWAAYKNNEIITSSRGLTSLYKLGFYILFIYVTFSFYREYQELETISNIAKYAHVYIISHALFWELFSVDENLKKVGINLGLTSFFKTIYNKINEIIK